MAQVPSTSPELAAEQDLLPEQELLPKPELRPARPERSRSQAVLTRLLGSTGPSELPVQSGEPPVQPARPPRVPSRQSAAAPGPVSRPGHHRTRRTPLPAPESRARIAYTASYTPFLKHRGAFPGRQGAYREPSSRSPLPASLCVTSRLQLWRRTDRFRAFPPKRWLAVFPGRRQPPFQRIERIAWPEWPGISRLGVPVAGLKRGSRRRSDRCIPGGAR